LETKKKKKKRKKKKKKRKEEEVGRLNKKATSLLAPIRVE
jgi:hypothetical protein